MHRALLLSVAGLITGLSAATWSTHPGALTMPPVSSGAALVQDPAPAAGQPQETDRQRLERKVRKLLVDNGTKATQKQGIDAMLEQVQKAGLPAEFAEKFKARFDLDHVLDLAVKIYADHLDEATVDGLIAFYATPAGKKLAEATPDIMTELMQASAEYGEKIGREVGEELSK